MKRWFVLSRGKVLKQTRFSVGYGSYHEAEFMQKSEAEAFATEYTRNNCVETQVYELVTVVRIPVEKIAVGESK